jgi:hypothetical protein
LWLLERNTKSLFLVENILNPNYLLDSTEEFVSSSILSRNGFKLEKQFYFEAKRSSNVKLVPKLSRAMFFIKKNKRVNFSGKFIMLQ